MIKLWASFLCCLAVAACNTGMDEGATAGSDRTAPDSATETADTSALFNVEWQLAELGGEPAPAGAGNRKATLVFTDSTGRAGGFAGCNGASGAFTLEGDSLSFGPIVSTKMACSQGMDLEQKYVAALEAVRAYRITDGNLILLGEEGELARFVAAGASG